VTAPARPGAGARRRIGSAERREQILDAAARVIVGRGFLPVPAEAVAREAQVSKGLVYAYFPTLHDLDNAVLVRAATALAARLDLLEMADFERWAVACAGLYFDDIAEGGALLHILYTDPVLDHRRDPAALAVRNALWRALIRTSRGYVRLSLKEAVAALGIVLSLPEETGRLAHRGELETARARDLCGQLVLSALRGLKAAPPTATEG
jgi:AcrR family transcriptional regulator